MLPNLNLPNSIDFKNDSESNDVKNLLKLKNIIQSDFFQNFSKLTQTTFQYSENNHQICSSTSIDDAPENFVMIMQNQKQNTTMVYLPLNNLNCSRKDSPLMKFVELHKLFDIPLER